MGAVVVIVNLPDIKPNEIKLTGEVLADIFAGNITKWNDPKLVELNHGVKLPSLAIAPVHRADGSGTTYRVHLLSLGGQSRVEEQGRRQHQRELAGRRRRQGQRRRRRHHAQHARRHRLRRERLRDAEQAGHHAAPQQGEVSLSSRPWRAYSAAAANGDWANAKNYAVNLIDQPGEKSWPIVSATFIELPKDPKDAARSAAVMKFFDWAYKSGDSIAGGLEYIPLPDPVKAAVRNAWRAEVKGPDGKPLM